LVQAQVIAVVDDSPIVLDALEHALEAWGYRVELYASAAAFRAAAGTTQAVCLLVDVHLGDDSGIRLVSDLAGRGLAVPVIFMTGCDDDCVRAAATALGCSAFLLKPFSPAEMLQAIEHAVASRQK
jgi:FixJ family two-component response regulator